jgi:phenylacetate-CoA ligase
MTTTAAGAPHRSTATPQALTGELLARDRWTRAQVVAHQRAALEALLRDVVARSPYYREALGPEPWTRPLSELPTLTKATMMERWDDIVTDPALRLADVEAQVSAADYAGRVAAGARACSTSGSTGRCGLFVLAEDELDVWLAAARRGLARIGVGPGTRLWSVGAPAAAHMSRHMFSGLRGTPMQEPPPISVLTPLSALARHVQAAQPEVLLGYPTVLAALADEQRHGRLDIAPRVVVTLSEVLSEDAVERMRSAWGIEAREAYPTTEAPVIASGTPSDRDLWIAEDLVIVEVVDADNAPVPFGTPGHKVLLTNLVHRVQPLIRYELADALTLAPPDGLPWTRISRIEGRTAEILELPAARGGTVRLHPHRLRRAFVRLPEVSMYQLVVGPRRVTARIVPGPQAGPGLAADVERELGAELREAGAAAPVAVEAVAAIERDARKAGKLQAVVVER